MTFVVIVVDIVVVVIRCVTNWISHPAAIMLYVWQSLSTVTTVNDSKSISRVRETLI